MLHATGMLQCFYPENSHVTSQIHSPKGWLSLIHLLDAKCLDNALPSFASTITHAHHKKKIFATVCIERENTLEDNLRLPCVLEVKKNYVLVAEIRMNTNSRV